MQHVKKKRSKALEVLISVVLIGGALGAAYFMVTSPDDFLSIVDSAFSLFRSETTEEKGKKKDGETENEKAAEASRGDRPGETEPDPGEDVASRAPLPAPTSTTTPRALRLLEKAQSLYASMDYSGAAKALASLSPGELSDEDGREVRSLREKAKAFADIVEGIEPLELADGRDVVVLHLANGGEVKGRILKEEGGYIQLQLNHGIRHRFSAGEVDRIESLSRAEILRRREEAYEAQKRKAGTLTPVMLFTLAEYCIRQGLFHKVTPLLEQGMAADPLFPETVYNEKAKRVYALFLWYKGKRKETLAAKTLEELLETFPHSFYTKKAQEDEKIKPSRTTPPRPASVEGPSKEPPPHASPGDTQPEPGSGEEPTRVELPEDADLIEAAEQALAEAREHEANSFPGKPDADRENLLAIQGLEKAIRLYEEAQRTYPSRASEFEEILQSMYASLFWCKKRQTLG